MLVGSADPAVLGIGAPVLADWKTEPLVLPGVEILQVVCEIAAADSEALLPPALHPTLPPLVGWLVYQVPESPCGPFTLAQTRLECRSGVRPRGFLVGAACDNEAAGELLSSRWGYRVRPAELAFERGYDRSGASVAFDGDLVLEVGLDDPVPLAPGDVQYVANMNLCETPRGLRLLQVDPEAAVGRAERGAPRIEQFDAAAWGAPGIEPIHPVSASLCTAELVLPALRYVCRPDTLAFQGTERAE